MDFISSRTQDIMQMSLDGLYERSKAIAANTANAMTPGYKRKEVSFEESLQNIIKRENEKEQIKAENMQKYKNNPADIINNTPLEKLAFLSEDIDKDFYISTDQDNSPGFEIDGNNVSIESEMMDEAQNSLKYNTVARLMSRSFENLRNVLNNTQG